MIAGIMQKQVTLMPGEYYVGFDDITIRTLLGSCVAIVFWCQPIKMGAMCHYLLPSRNSARHGGCDGRYADQAVSAIVDKFRQYTVQVEEIDIHVFGAANMFSTRQTSCADQIRVGRHLCEGCQMVSCRNRMAAFSELEQHGLRAAKIDLGGTKYRSIALNNSTGEIIVRECAENNGCHVG